MKALSSPYPALDLPADLYRHLVYTLTGLLPPPLDDTREALDARNHAAIAKVAALLPVDANEVDLAAQCIAARAQAEDVLRLLRQHAGDIALVMRLNAQYGSMVRTSLSVHGRLMRVQALRRKRDSIDGAANQDARARDIAELSLLKVAFQDAAPRQEASPERARTQSPERARTQSPEGARTASPELARTQSPERPRATAPERARTVSPEVPPAETRPELPKEAPADCEDQSLEDHVSEYGTNSHDTGFETWLSEQPWNRGGSVEMVLQDMVHEAMAQSRLADLELAATSRESPKTADDRCQRDGQTAPARSGYNINPL